LSVRLPKIAFQAGVLRRKGLAMSDTIAAWPSKELSILFEKPIDNWQLAIGNVLGSVD
jgi:hypothetical protein